MEKLINIICNHNLVDIDVNKNVEDLVKIIHQEEGLQLAIMIIAQTSTQKIKQLYTMHFDVRFSYFCDVLCDAHPVSSHD